MTLYDYQERLKTAVLSGQSIILQAPTGAGKTRAALAPFVEAFFDLPFEAFPHKCVYAVPMRVLANQFFEEYNNLAKKYEDKFRREQLLKIKRQTGEYPDDKEFTADLTFATIDQVLSSWLLHPYSLSRRKGNINAGALVGSYLIFDEFHLFDPDSTLPTTLHLLRSLKEVCPFVLMTATFSADMLTKLAQLLGAEPFLLSPTDLQDIKSQQKERRFHVHSKLLVQENVPDFDFVLQSHYQLPEECQRSIVIFNQVERAQRFYQALSQNAPNGVEICLLHSRFRQGDRQQLEQKIQREFGKDKSKYQHKSMILVATQVVEVGLDVTSQVLHTELAPASAVLQRSGRCARYEGETGDVYVYPVEHYAPYHGKLAKQQCELTQEWLNQHQDRHLSFADEQDLVNYVHTPADKLILEGLAAGKAGHSDKIQELWCGAGERSDAKRLIRDTTSQAIIVHSDPLNKDILRNPFACEMFSLYPGIVRGKFQVWQEETKEDYDQEGLPWVVCKLVESESESEDQGNRPIQYDWKVVKSEYELSAPVLLIHPRLVGYDKKLGLTLFPGTLYECNPPPPKERQIQEIFYRLESYYDHIRLVYDEFQMTQSRTLQGAASRLERWQGWRPGLVSDMAHLVVWLHDTGKLATGWQGWAKTWQNAIGQPLATSEAVAHTDFDAALPLHKEQAKKLDGKRPFHAIESAFSAVPYLLTLVEGKTNHPLFQAAFTAIARHHAPFTETEESYQLVKTAVQEIHKTLVFLPHSLQTMCQQVTPSLALDKNHLPANYIRENLLVREDDIAGMCCYFLLVRALRLADQAGTKRGSK